MMDVEERVSVVTCKIKGMKCEKIGEGFERKFHKKSPTGNMQDKRHEMQGS